MKQYRNKLKVIGVIEAENKILNRFVTILISFKQDAIVHIERAESGIRAQQEHVKKTKQILKEVRSIEKGLRKHIAVDLWVRRVLLRTMN